MNIYDKMSDGSYVIVVVVSLYHKSVVGSFFFLSHIDIANWIIFFLTQWIHRVEHAIFGFDYCLIISTENFCCHLRWFFGCIWLIRWQNVLNICHSKVIFIYALFYMMTSHQNKRYPCLYRIEIQCPDKPLIHCIWN